MICPDCQHEMIPVAADLGDRHTPPSHAEWFCTRCGLSQPVTDDDEEFLAKLEEREAKKKKFS